MLLLRRVIFQFLLNGALFDALYLRGRRNEIDINRRYIGAEGNYEIPTNVAFN